MLSMLNDVERRKIDLPERKQTISVLDWGGDGPPVLLHHANGFCGALWAPVAEQIRDRFRVFAVDARGHGDSSRPDPSHTSNYRWSDMADDLAAVGARLLEDLAAPRFALLAGHSFGGTLSMAAESRHPGLTERVLMVDPVIIPPSMAARPERAEHASSMSERARGRRNGWETREEARAHFAERSLFAEWEARSLDLYVAEGLRERIGGGFELKCPGAVEGAIFAGDQGMDVLRVASAVRVPVRVLWARHGNFARPIYEAMVETMRAAEVVDFDGGHLVVMEKPRIVVDEIRRFAGPASQTEANQEANRE